MVFISWFYTWSKSREGSVDSSYRVAICREDISTFSQIQGLEKCNLVFIFIAGLAFLRNKKDQRISSNLADFIL